MRNPLLLAFSSLTVLVAIACGGDDGNGALPQGNAGSGGNTQEGAGGGEQAGSGTAGSATAGSGTSGSGTAGSGAGMNITPLPESQAKMGCDGASLLASKQGGDDPGVRGPWPVGVQTVTIDGLTTEVWYPAKIGSQAGKAYAQYDIREQLPDKDATKIPDAKNPLQNCDCHRDLPLDTEHGKYPVVLFIHGTAAFRTQSLTQMTHWASRGFVVLSADHPKIRL